MALYYRSLGDLSLAMQLLHEGTQAARQAGDRRRECRNDVNIGFICIQLGLYPQARAVLEEGKVLADMIGEQGLLAALQDNLIFVFWCTGERELAIALSEQLEEEFKTKIHNPFGQSANAAQLGTFLSEKGNWAQAVTKLAEARTAFAKLGAIPDSMEQQALEAKCLLALGHQEKAQALAGEVWSYLREYGSTGFNFPSKVYLYLADVFAAIGAPLSPAHEVIEAGHRELLQRAAKISTVEWRRSFLENVAENREIIERWKKINDDP